jgi:hypothetical protein
LVARLSRRLCGFHVPGVHSLVDGMALAVQPGALLHCAIPVRVRA